MSIGFGYLQIAVIAALASIVIPRIPHVKHKNGKGKNEPSTTGAVEEASPASAHQAAVVSGGD
jgi:hypothetical protein